MVLQYFKNLKIFKKRFGDNTALTPSSDNENPQVPSEQPSGEMPAQESMVASVPSMAGPMDVSASSASVPPQMPASTSAPVAAQPPVVATPAATPTSGAAEQVPAVSEQAPAVSEQTPAVPAADELRELLKGQEELRKGQEELRKGQEDITEALCAICESGLVELEKDIAKLREDTAKVTEKEEIIDKLHTELLATRKQVSGELVKPYLRVMMEFSGKLEGITAHYAEKLDALEELPPAVLDFKKEMMSISEMLVDTLDDTFGYVVFAPEIGEKFNPREANCVGRVAAEQNGQEGQTGTIARVSRRGFRDAESGQIIMFPDVVVFK